MSGMKASSILACLWAKHISESDGCLLLPEAIPQYMLPDRDKKLRRERVHCTTPKRCSAQPLPDAVSIKLQG